MDEKHIEAILESLAETIKKLKSEKFWLEFENKQLKEKIAMYESPCQEVNKNAKEF